MEKYSVNRPFSLSQLSALELSKPLWARPEVKQLMIQCIEEDKLWSKNHGTRLQNTLRAKISRQVDELWLPELIKKDVRFAVERMGTSMRQCLEDLKKNEKDRPVSLALYIDHIRWTHNGSVDSSATVRAMYISNVLPENSKTWIELCNLCLEDCLIDLWPKVSEIEGSKETEAHSVASLYWCCRMQNRLREQLANFTEKTPDCLDGYSIEENMFAYNFFSGTYSAVKYFWKCLNKDERKRMIICVSHRIITNYPDYFRSDGIVLIGDIDKMHDIVIFLLQHLSFYELNSLLIQILRFDYVLIQFLIWPYVDPFLELLEDSWKYHRAFRGTVIFSWILIAIESLYSATGIDSHYREMFHNVWKKLGSNVEEHVDVQAVIMRLWIARDIGLLNNVINDERLKTSREKFVNLLIKFVMMVKPPDLVYLNEFIANVLVSEEERGMYKTYIANAIK